LAAFGRAVILEITNGGNAARGNAALPTRAHRLRAAQRVPVRAARRTSRYHAIDGESAHVDDATTAAGS